MAHTQADNSLYYFVGFLVQVSFHCGVTFTFMKDSFYHITKGEESWNIATSS